MPHLRSVVHKRHVTRERGNETRERGIVRNEIRVSMKQECKERTGTISAFPIPKFNLDLSSWITMDIEEAYVEAVYGVEAGMLMMWKPCIEEAC